MGQFHTTKISAGNDGCSVIVEGRVLSGEVRTGMELHIPLNGSFSTTVPIREVCAGGAVLVLDCEDNDEVEFVLALNLGDEVLEIAMPY